MNNDKRTDTTQNPTNRNDEKKNQSANWGGNQNPQDKNRQGSPQGQEGDNKGGSTSTTPADAKTSGGNDQKR